MPHSKLKGKQGKYSFMFVSKDTFLEIKKFKIKKFWKDT